MSDIEIAVEVEANTDKAIMVENLKGEKVWIPKSQISDYSGENLDEAESIFIREWLAGEKDLI